MRLMHSISCAADALRRRDEVGSDEPILRPEELEGLQFETAVEGERKRSRSRRGRMGERRRRGRRERRRESRREQRDGGMAGKREGPEGRVEQAGSQAKLPARAFP